MIENMHSQEIQHFRDDTDYNNSKSFRHVAEYITEMLFCMRGHFFSSIRAIFCFAKNRATTLSSIAARRLTKNSPLDCFCPATQCRSLGSAPAPAASLASLSPVAGYAALRIPCPCKLAGGRGSMLHMNSTVQNLFQKFSEYLSHLCNCLRNTYLLHPASFYD